MYFIILPFFNLQMSKSDAVAQTVRSKLSAAEQASPGVCLDLLLSILKKTEANVSIHESILRLQGTVDDAEGRFQFMQCTTFLDLLIV